MWKFHDFSIAHILREIKFEDSRSAKTAISTHLEVLNFDFYELLHFLKDEIHTNQQTKPPKWSKRQFLTL